MLVARAVWPGAKENAPEDFAVVESPRLSVVREGSLRPAHTDKEHQTSQHPWEWHT